jgi:hypothetical protein
MTDFYIKIAGFYLKTSSTQFVMCCVYLFLLVSIDGAKNYGCSMGFLSRSVSKLHLENCKGEYRCQTVYQKYDQFPTIMQVDHLIL